MSTAGLEAAVAKMQNGGVHPTAIDVFRHYYKLLESGETGILRESDLTPLENPTRLADLDIEPDAARAAVAQTVVIKLNGGLGTSMGMDRAKSLLEVRDGLTFLDIIARQVLHARKEHDARLPLVFMNSFRTRDDTLAALAGYPDLPVDDLPLDFLQNREPKLRADDLTPVEWPADPGLEWCPPGHGDLYTALAVSGILDRLLEAGFRYASVSNSDNLQASVDPQVAGWFAGTGARFASEVCRRTSADRKGGHLAIRISDGQLVLRESAQTADEDAEAFADITRHRYFNTNNLWLDLRALATTLAESDGVLGLPMIKNTKTVDPADSSSPEVIQLETAMGAAVEVFPGAVALEVDRTRFLPIKSTNDLLGLRSDVYTLGADYRVRLVDGVEEAPFVDLDSAHYKVVKDFDARFPEGAPSLVEATSLVVHGDWTFEAGVVVHGAVELDEEGSPGRVAAGAVLGG